MKTFDSQGAEQAWNARQPEIDSLRSLVGELVEFARMVQLAAPLEFYGLNADALIAKAEAAIKDGGENDC